MSSECSTNCCVDAPEEPGAERRVGLGAQRLKCGATGPNSDGIHRLRFIGHDLQQEARIHRFCEVPVEARP